MNYIHKETNLPLSENLRNKFHNVIQDDSPATYLSLSDPEKLMFEDFKSCIIDTSNIANLFKTEHA